MAARQSTLADDLLALAWKPQVEQDLLDEVNAPKTMRQAQPGEVFVLTVHRNPGGHSRPSKSTKKLDSKGKPKMVKVKGLSVNDWMGLDWMYRQNLTDELKKVVQSDVDEQRCPAFHEGRPYVQVTYYFKDRRGRDWANYGKQVIDSIVKAGVLKDDNDRAIDLDRNRIVEGDKNPRIEITIQDTRTP